VDCAAKVNALFCKRQQNFSFCIWDYLHFQVLRVSKAIQLERSSGPCFVFTFFAASDHEMIQGELGSDAESVLYLKIGAGDG